MSKNVIRKDAVVRDSSDDAQIALAHQVEEDRERDIEFIMAQPRGRRWMFDLIYAHCHVDRISHVPGDANSTAFNEGGRSIGQTILNDVMRICPALHLKMIEENIDDD